MNIVLLGHDDIASKIALRAIVAGLPEHAFHLFLSGTASSTAVEPPGALVELGRLDTALYESQPWDVGCKPRELPAPNSPAGVAALRACDADLVISVRYRRILHAEAIAVARHGVLNLHSGLLPEYRGVMATFWAMLKGDAEIGCTLHWIVDATIDTGPIIGVSRIPARMDRSYLANVLALYPAGCAMTIDAVRRIAAGQSLGALPQAGAGHYYSTPTAKDLARFAALGLRLADCGDLDDFVAGTE